MKHTLQKLTLRLAFASVLFSFLFSQEAKAQLPCTAQWYDSTTGLQANFYPYAYNLIYHWDFGDGSTSSLTMPTHTYATPDTYLVCLMTSDSLLTCFDTMCYNVIIDTNQTCSAYFAASSYSGCGTPFTVAFNNYSFGTGGATYYWDFGDGSTSTLMNPVHIYNATGSFYVTMTATFGGCSSSYAVWITVYSNPVVSINATPNPTCVGSTVSFTSSVTGGTPSSYSWAFQMGTPGTSTLANPNIQFNTAGTFTASITVTTTNGCVATANQSIVINPTCSHDTLSGHIWYDANQNNAIDGGEPGVQNFGVYFPAGLFGGGYYAYTDVNGDYTAVVSSGSNTLTGYAQLGYAVTFPASHSYTVSGNTTGLNFGLDSCASAGFTYSNTGNTYFFTSTATGSGALINNWGFGDGGYSSLLNPSHTYAIGGTYTVYYSVYDSLYGCYDSTGVTLNVTIPGGDTLSGHLWQDMNGNSFWDVGEPAAASHYVHIVQGVSSYYFLTDANGYYELTVTPATYTVNGYINAPEVQTYPVSPTNYTIVSTGGSHYSGLDFGYVPNGYGYIQGRVYYDTNGNGVSDAGEPGMSGYQLHAGTHVTYAGWNGYYYFYLPIGSYTVSVNPGTLTIMQPVSPNTYSISVTGGSNSTGNNFGLLNGVPGINFSIHLSTYTTVTPGFPAWYYITVTNIGTISAGGHVTMMWDPNLTYQTSTYPAPVSLNTGAGIVEWDFAAIPPMSSVHFYPDFTTNLSAILGNPILNFAMVETTPPGNDVDYSDNTDSLHQVVVASWDPNLKECEPFGNGTAHVIAPGSTLNYTIAFQNTGTAPAVNVIVTDTLQNDLDMNSFAMVAASDSYNIEVEGRVIRWIFNNIMLPDSGTNQQGSHGYISFHINHNPGIPNGTVIDNSANIYFDFNSAVITPVVSRKIDVTGIEEVNPAGQVQIVPNPASGFIYLRIVDGVQLQSVSLCDLTGKLIEMRTENMNAWNISQLAAGEYFFRARTTDGMVLTEKLNIIH